MEPRLCDPKLQLDLGPALPWRAVCSLPGQRQPAGLGSLGSRKPELQTLPLPGSVTWGFRVPFCKVDSSLQLCLPYRKSGELMDVRKLCRL